MKRFISLCVFVSLWSINIIAQTTFVHPWQGKRVAYFGDSITDPKEEGGSKKYWAFLQDYLDITPYVYGISGWTWRTISNQAERLKDEHGQDFDAILILMGTNDFNAGIPIGEWYEETIDSVYVGTIKKPKHLEARKHRTINTNLKTYRGRINDAMQTIKQMFPTKQIVLLTPIHRACFYHDERNWQPTEDWANSCGEFIDAYVESVKEAGNIWAVPVIDLNATCGLYPLMDEFAQYFNDADKDRLHPHDKGNARMAKTLVYQLLTLPCTFE